MDISQFLHWGLWPWLGHLISSDAFLNLMVPVTTLAGVVLTIKNNERARGSELRTNGEKWNFEVEKASAAEQRAAVLAGALRIQEIFEEAETKKYEERLDFWSRFGPSEDGEETWSNDNLVNIMPIIDTRGWVLAEVDKSVLTMELAISDPNVAGALRGLRGVVDKRVEELAEWRRTRLEDFPATFVIENARPKGLPEAMDAVKAAAIEHLHPLPPDMGKPEPKPGKLS